LGKIIPLTAENQSHLHRISELFKKIRQKQNSVSYLVGFDGFIDELSLCVDKRISQEHYERLGEITQLAARIQGASGRSCNIELVPMQKKLGGNAPILANALARSGSKVALIGAMGAPTIDPIFQDLCSRCIFYASIANPGYTDAIEFLDGKILLGKLTPIHHITVESVLKTVPKATFIQLIDHVDLVACTNWTMIPAMTDIFQFLLESVYPFVTKKRRLLFIDLADPAKRSVDDLKRALMILKSLQSVCSVCLGLNVSEAEQVAAALSVSSKNLCPSIQKALGIEQVVVHAHDHSVGADASNSYRFDGPYFKNPKVLTGGGDNFNAGYCLGLASGLHLEECLFLGNHTAGYYVLNGESPSLSELEEFCLQKN